jgi:hypothetical protein
MVEEQHDFLKALMVMPKKPEFVGFTENPEDMYDKLVDILSAELGMDMRPHTAWDSGDEDYQFYFNIYTWDLEDKLSPEQYENLFENMPWDPNDYWDVTDYLFRKYYGVDTWVYAQVRPYDNDYMDVQIGVPKDL